MWKVQEVYTFLLSTCKEMILQCQILRIYVEKNFWSWCCYCCSWSIFESLIPHLSFFSSSCSDLCLSPLSLLALLQCEIVSRFPTTTTTYYLLRRRRRTMGKTRRHETKFENLLFTQTTATTTTRSTIDLTLFYTTSYAHPPHPLSFVLSSIFL